jgi:putative acetyltransferase
LVVSLVAEAHGRLIGQITFSPAYPSDGSPHWYALGPVAVLPEYQLSGVGSRLIDAGLTGDRRDECCRLHLDG